jgi:arylsulfatase A-like enzyme
MFKSMGLLLVAYLWCSSSWAIPPNILFLLSDDHSYPFLGAYGNKDVRTPNIDQLAAQGMRFDRMFVTSPSCVPSRASLMTGRSPVAVRMGRFTSPLPAEISALPDLLRDKAGYFTGVGGRDYHLDGPPADKRPFVNKILDQYGLRTFQDRLDYVQTTPDLSARAALSAFLDVIPSGKPWFFWLGFVDPHHSWTSQGPLGLPDPAKLTVPGYLPDLPGVRDDLAHYIAEVEHLDIAVKEVLAVLSQRGFANNTVVVFMGDNGYSMPHGKGALHDPGVHVPLLVRWPGVVRPGSVTRQLVSGEDFAPTMLEIAGIVPPEEMSGVSYLKLLKGDTSFVGRKYIFTARVPHGGDGVMRANIPASLFDLSRSVRSANFKLIYNTTPNQPVEPLDSLLNPSWLEIKAAFAASTLAPQFVRAYFTLPRATYELYDLQADPNELVNLASNQLYSTVLLELKEALAEKMVLDWDFLPPPMK